MTYDELKKTYSDIISQRETELAVLKSKIFRIGSLRLAVVLLCLVSGYILWGNTQAVLAVTAVSVVAFLFLLKLHNRLFFKRRYCELQADNARNELKALAYDFSAFDGAPERVDGMHSFSLDLDLFGKHSFFQSVNRCVTAYGKDCLADTLLQPLADSNEILKRQQAIAELSTKIKLAAHFRATGQMQEVNPLDMEKLSGKLSSGKQIGRTFWRFMPYITPLSFVAVAVLLSLGVPPLIPTSFIGLWWAVMFIVSLLPIKSIKEKISYFEKNFDTLQTYSRLFAIIENETFESELLKELQAKVKAQTPASKAIHQLRSHSNNLDQSFTVIGMIFLNPIVFWDVIYGIKIEKWIECHKDSIGSWFTAIAQFDSLISLGMYAYNHPDYTFAQPSDSFVFEAKDLGHPMLDRNVCVRNDVTISRRPYFLVVTGANMAGKSTYLRTVGINMMLACIGAPVCAASMTFYPYRLVTNLRTSDSLADNESYFFAELKRLKMIIDRLQSGEELFIILDEILKGTNSEDKQKGSIALMKQLIELGGNGIIATHDLVLGNLEKEYPDEVKDYRFEADITNEQLTFSYKIREGVAQNMNACFLMKKMGITGL